MSTHPSGEDRLLLLTCPICNAPPGQLCLTADGNYARRMHVTRRGAS